MITTGALANTSIMSQSYHFFQCLMAPLQSILLLLKSFTVSPWPSETLEVPHHSVKFPSRADPQLFKLSHYPPHRHLFAGTSPASSKTPHPHPSIIVKS